MLIIVCSTLPVFLRACVCAGVCGSQNGHRSMQISSDLFLSWTLWLIYGKSLKMSRFYMFFHNIFWKTVDTTHAMLLVHHENPSVGASVQRWCWSALPSASFVPLLLHPKRDVGLSVTGWRGLKRHSRCSITALVLDQACCSTITVTNCYILINLHVFVLQGCVSTCWAFLPSPTQSELCAVPRFCSRKTLEYVQSFDNSGFGGSHWWGKR